MSVSLHSSVGPSVIHLSVHILFLDDSLNKHQWIFTKLGMCIDIVAIWFGIANGQILPIFSFPDDNLCKCQGILTKLGTCIDINPCLAE